MPTRPLTHWLPDTSGIVSAYVVSRTWGQHSPFHHAWGLFTEDARLMGGIVLHDFDLTNCYISWAIEPGHLFTRAVLREAATMAFEHRGVSRITGLQLATNDRARAGALFGGFKHEGILRRAHPNGDDLHIYGLIKEDCTVFTKGGSHGRQGSSSESRQVQAAS